MLKPKCLTCDRPAHPCYRAYCEDCWARTCRPINDDNGRAVVTAEGLRFQPWGTDRHWVKPKAEHTG